MPEITMPKLSDTMEEGKILRWLVQPGQAVQVGDVLVEVETDKADMEIEAEHGGVLREIKLQEGDSGPVGAVIALVDDGSAAPADASEATTEPEPAAEAPAEPATARPGASVAPPPPAEPAPTSQANTPRPPDPPPSPSIGTTKVSPLARTRAAELGIDPTTLTGTGPGGRVTRKDVEDAHQAAGAAAPSTPAPATPPSTPAQATPPSAGEAGSGTVTVRPPPREPVASPPRSAPVRPSGDVQRIPLTGMRAAIARRMTESKRDAPHFYVTTVAAMDDAVQLRRGLKASGGVAAGVTYNHLILKACADALRVVPEMNARFAGDAIEILPDVNLGVATAVPDGLIVPVIHHADQLSLFDVATRARELGEKAKQRNFGGHDLSGATFSVSNLGMYDVESFVAVINPPQAGILAVGSVSERPVVRDAELAAGHTVHLTVSCDHRAVDGALAAEFLREVRERLENPIRLLVPRETE